MLCTPPAFILSQDQTLECLYLILPSRASSNLLFECYLSFSYFCLSCIFLSEIFEFRSRTYFYACTSLFVVQFSMTVSLPRFRDSFVIISQTLLFVNRFLQTFLTFFQIFCDIFVALELATCTLYHIVYFLSIAFLKFFKKFFRIIFWGFYRILFL